MRTSYVVSQGLEVFFLQPGKTVTAVGRSACWRVAWMTKLNLAGQENTFGSFFSLCSAVRRSGGRVSPSQFFLHPKSVIPFSSINRDCNPVLVQEDILIYGIITEIIFHAQTSSYQHFGNTAGIYLIIKGSVQFNNWWGWAEAFAVAGITSLQWFIAILFQYKSTWLC